MNIKKFIAIFLMGLALFVFFDSLYKGTNAIGKTIAGFYVDNQGTVNTLLHPRWPGTKAGLKVNDEIYLYNGTPFSTLEKFQKDIESLPEKTPITYYLSRDRKPLTLVIPTMKFTYDDFIDVFLSCMLIGYIFILAGALIFFYRPHLASSFPFFITSYWAGMTNLLLIDHYTSQSFNYLYYITTTTLSISQIYNAWYMLEPRPWLKKFPFFFLSLFGMTWTLVSSLYIGSTFFQVKIQHINFLCNLLFLIAIIITNISYAYINITTKSLVTKKRANILGLAGLTLLPAYTYYICRDLFGIVLPPEMILFQIYFILFVFLSMIRFNAMEYSIQMSRRTMEILATALFLGLAFVDFLYLPPLFRIYGLSNNSLTITLYILESIKILMVIYALHTRQLDRLFFYSTYRFSEAIQSFNNTLLSHNQIPKIIDSLAEILNTHFKIEDTVVYLASQENGDFLRIGPELTLLTTGEIPLLPAVITRETFKMEKKEFIMNPMLPNGQTRTLLIPIVYGKQVLGLALLGPKQFGNAYSPEDIGNIRTLLTTTALAVSNAQSYKTILQLQEQLKLENQELRDEVRKMEVVRPKIIGENSGLKEVLYKVDMIKNSTGSVLLRGESGTGKEVIATIIHQRSTRKNGPFVTINCSAIPEHLLESELFGHERGAFTDAYARKIGLFEKANNGTLFLDEIGDMSLNLQAKILRVLQEKEIRRIGGNELIPVDVRVIAATHRNLEEMIEKKIFREDLFYRLYVFPITIPSLRERKQDIEEFLNYFLTKFSAEMDKTVLPPDGATLNQLKNYAWPGNVREFQNMIERSVALSANGAQLKIEMLDDNLKEFPSNQVNRIYELKSYHEQMDDFQKNLVTSAINKAGGNKTKAARELGIHVTHLYKIIKQLKIEI